MSFELDPSYKQVPDRIADFKAKHPEGSLRAANPDKPFELVTIGSQTFIVFCAAAFRAPDDPAPGIGTAWEPVPGKTPYTRDSELQNAETSAWGRAIVAVLASESKSVASAEDVRNRQADQDSSQHLPPPLPDGWESREELEGAWGVLVDTTEHLDDDALKADIKAWVKAQRLTMNKLTFALYEEWSGKFPALDAAGEPEAAA